MAEAHLDHPGNVTWFAGYGPAPVVGPCPHRACPHDMAGTIAWGPDYDHYSLNLCTVPADKGGCGRECRAWSAEYPHPFDDGPKFRMGTFRHIPEGARR